MIRVKIIRVLRQSKAVQQDDSVQQLETGRPVVPWAVYRGTPVVMRPNYQAVRPLMYADRPVFVSLNEKLENGRLNNGSRRVSFKNQGLVVSFAAHWYKSIVQVKNGYYDDVQQQPSGVWPSGPLIATILPAELQRPLKPMKQSRPWIVESYYNQPQVEHIFTIWYQTVCGLSPDE